MFLTETCDCDDICPIFVILCNGILIMPYSLLAVYIFDKTTKWQKNIKYYIFRIILYYY